MQNAQPAKLLTVGACVIALVGITTWPMARADGAAAVQCGNHVLEPSETCSDYPVYCTVQPCSPAQPARRISIQFTAPADKEISGMTILLGYNSALVSLPGKGGDGSVSARIADQPEQAIVAAKDLDSAPRLRVGRTRPISAGALATIQFDSCAGAAAPTAADFACTVE